MITGRPALEPGADADLVSLFRDIVVVRGARRWRRATRSRCTCRRVAVPEEEPDDDEAATSGDLKPFERGPEITEIH